MAEAEAAEVCGEPERDLSTDESYEYVWKNVLSFTIGVVFDRISGIFVDVSYCVGSIHAM